MAAVQRALASGAPPHAWLFAGPEGVGKATLARWLAQAVNCERNAIRAGGVGAQHPQNVARTNGEPSATISARTSTVVDAAPLHSAVAQESGVEPCGECAQCSRIERGIHADVMTVSIPERERDEPLHKDISVDQVREVERAVSLAPFEGRTRVVIFDPADRLSQGAQNAFLKTLEEPPANALFVLIASQEERLLPTIRSRCQRVEFGMVPAAEIENRLLQLNVDVEKARLLARLAAGRPGRALTMASDASQLERRRKLLEQARSLGSMPMVELIDITERLARRFREDREDVLERVGAWLSWWRDVLFVQSGAPESATAVDLMDALREDASRYEPTQVVAFVQALVKCRKRLEGNVQARIALDALVATAPRAITAASH